MAESARSLVRQGYEAFNRGEGDAVLDLLDEHVELRAPPNSLEPQPLRG
jgi:ketosteroid isomerase-like protein